MRRTGAVVEDDGSARETGLPRAVEIRPLTETGAVGARNSCQKRLLCPSGEPFDVVPATGWPIVPVIENGPPPNVPPPFASTDCTISNCPSDREARARGGDQKQNSESGRKPNRNLLIFGLRLKDRKLRNVVRNAIFDPNARTVEDEAGGRLADPNSPI